MPGTGGTGSAWFDDGALPGHPDSGSPVPAASCILFSCFTPVHCNLAAYAEPRATGGRCLRPLQVCRAPLGGVLWMNNQPAVE